MAPKIVPWGSVWMESQRSIHLGIPDPHSAHILDGYLGLRFPVGRVLSILKNRILVGVHYLRHLNSYGEEQTLRKAPL